MKIKEIKTKDALELELGSGADKFLLFYSAWCPYCMAFSPVFEKLAAGEPAAFCKVCTDSVPEAEDSFSIDVVPTVLFFRHGKLEKRLDGLLGRGLTSDGLEDFVRRCRGGKKRP